MIGNFSFPQRREKKYNCQRSSDCCCFLEFETEKHWFISWSGCYVGCGKCIWDGWLQGPLENETRLVVNPTVNLIGWRDTRCVCEGMSRDNWHVGQQLREKTLPWMWPAPSNRLRTQKEQSVEEGESQPAHASSSTLPEWVLLLLLPLLVNIRPYLLGPFNTQTHISNSAGSFQAFRLGPRWHHWFPCSEASVFSETPACRYPLLEYPASNYVSQSIKYPFIILYIQTYIYIYIYIYILFSWRTLTNA
jgi:hypothetical protein